MLKGVDSYLRIKLKEVRKHYPEWEYKEIGMAIDHVHLYMVIPPRYAVSEVVNVMKANTRRALKGKFRFLEKVYWDGRGIWGKGYFVSTVGIDEEIIRKYV